MKLGTHEGCWHAARGSPWWVDCKTGRFGMVPENESHLGREEKSHGGFRLDEALTLSEALGEFGTATIDRVWHPGEAGSSGRESLAEAIREHRRQKADDRCIEDDDRLYAALGDGIKCDRRVGSKEEMLKSCARFIDRRCEAGTWPTYSELEAERDALKIEAERLRTYVQHHPQCRARAEEGDPEYRPCSCGLVRGGP